MAEVESSAAAQKPPEVGATSGGVWRALRRNALPFFGGLVMVVAFLLVTSLLMEGIIRLIVGTSFEGSETPHAALTAVMVAVALVAVAVVFVFAAGLVDLLVQGVLRGRRGSIASTLAAFRSTFWLLLAALIVAPLVILIAFVAASAGLAAPLVIAFGAVVLVYGIYTVPLILDERLNTVRALADSARLVRIGGFVRQYVLLVLAVFAAIAFWRVVVHRIGSTGQYWEPRLGDAASWPVDGSGLALGLTHRAVMVSLLGAMAIAASCGALALLLAGMYASACRRRAAFEAGVPTRGAGARAEAPARLGIRVTPSAVRRRGAVVAVAALLLLMTAVTAFVWWYGTPAHEHQMKAGASATLRSGLSLTVPPGTTAWITRTRRYPAWLGLGDNGGLAVPTVFGSQADIVARDMGALIVASFSPEHDPSRGAWLLDEPLVGSSADGTVEMRWKSGSRYAYVFTHLPGRLDGMVQLRVASSWNDHRPVGPAQVLEGLASFWSAWNVRGVQPPAQSAWRSQSVTPGRRTALSSGLSLVMPHHWEAELASSARSNMPAQSFMPLRLEPRGLWYGEVLSLRSESDARLKWAVEPSMLRLVARSAGRRVEIYGSIDTGTLGRVAVVTRLPGRSIGLITGNFEVGKDGLSKAGALRYAVRMWKVYRVEGAKLPVVRPG
jgi:hypothetical protein